VLLILTHFSFKINFLRKQNKKTYGKNIKTKIYYNIGIMYNKMPKKNATFMKSLKKTSSKVLPSINRGISTIGKTTRTVAESSIPLVEKGMSAVYGTMATGADVGMKTLAKTSKMVSLKGGRRKRTHRKRRTSRRRKSHRRR
jgi:hypothetical protein